jgi:phospholipid/cholesterol/gamma-HCH transport system substrate-binding protein
MMVGAVVLVSLLVFVWMLLEFSSRTAEVFAPPQMAVYFECLRADGLSAGSAVTYLGVNVGRVTSVARTSDGKAVRISTMVDTQPPLPANLDAVIAQTNPIGGGSTLSLSYTGDSPEGELAPDSKVDATYVGLQLNFLPPAFTQAAGQIGTLSTEMQKTMTDLNDSHAIQNLADTIASIKTLTTDPQLRTNVDDAVANVRTTTVKLNTLVDGLQHNSDQLGVTLQSANQHMDDLSKQIGDRLTQLAVSLDNINQITAKINQGKGTAGQIVNDPQLYQALVDSVAELDATTKDLRRVIDQWEQEGVSLHLK